MMASSNKECEYDPDHLYHDHREGDELRAENERLRVALTEACDEIESWVDSNDETTTAWRALLAEGHGGGEGVD